MRRKSAEPARYVKQLTSYGKFCKSMLIDRYKQRDIEVHVEVNAP